MPLAKSPSPSSSSASAVLCMSLSSNHFANALLALSLFSCAEVIGPFNIFRCRLPDAATCFPRPIPSSSPSFPHRIPVSPLLLSFLLPHLLPSPSTSHCISSSPSSPSYKTLALPSPYDIVIAWALTCLMGPRFHKTSTIRRRLPIVCLVGAWRSERLRGWSFNIQ